jgi:hypothetical protein
LIRTFSLGLLDHDGFADICAGTRHVRPDEDGGPLDKRKCTIPGDRGASHCLFVAGRWFAHSQLNAASSAKLKVKALVSLS